MELLFLRASTVVDGKTEIDKEDIINMFEQAVEGISLK